MPAPARRSAMAAPIPREAPVTMATFIWSLDMSVLLVCTEKEIADRSFRIICLVLTSAVGSGEQSGMDRFDAMRLFVRLVERRSFTAAAADLGVPRSTASEVLKALEARLGARLIERTTRHVTPTLDGE